MKKHHLLAIFGLLIALPLLIYSAVNQASLRQNALGDTTKPNFVVIMTDDHRTDSMEYMPIVAERLGGQGVTFTHAYAVTPVCCPARAGFLTGSYTHNHGVWQNVPPHGGFESFRDKETLPVWLKRAGYRTGFIGKYMNGYPNRNKTDHKGERGDKYIPPGWDDWHGITGGRYYNLTLNENGKIRKYGRKASEYSTTLFRRKAINFIKNAKRPFFLEVATNAPHGDGSPEDAKSFPAVAQEHRGTCNNIPPYRSPSFNEEDVSDKPAWIRNKKKLTAQEIRYIDGFVKHQACALQAVDEMVGAIVKTLEATGKRENTVIIFVGDNGMSWGDHRHITKGCIYEGCAKVPLVISYPALTPNAAITDSFAQNVDLTATILELAGVAKPEKVNGISLVPVLSDPTAVVRENVLLETTHSKGHQGRDFAIRTTEYKYNELSNGEKELYDLTNDPYELENQVNNPAYASVIPDLAAKLATLKAE